MNQQMVPAFHAESCPELVFAYDKALENLLQINTREYPSFYPERCSLLPGKGSFIRAGAKYEKPWTRDASLNAWNAASLLCPEVAQNTLFAVCEDSEVGTRIQEDNQWWDRLIWIVAAWEHYLITGNKDFLSKAYPIAENSFRRTKEAYFCDKWGLFRGPAFMEDGISSYPAPVYQEGLFNPFVLRYESAHHIMCLSTNCAYYGAVKALAAMAESQGATDKARQYRAFAEDLKCAVLKHLRLEDGSFGYFLFGSGEKEGQLAAYRETLGISFAALLGMITPEEAAGQLAKAHVDPVGIVSVHPHFERFRDDFRGRHNGCYWPMIGGFFSHAAAKCGQADLFARLTQALAQLAKDGDGNFYEVYDPVTGQPDGGWQIEAKGFYHYPPYPHQTWSATGYLRMIFHGLFGMDFAEDGMYLAPTLPKHWGCVELSGIAYRDMELSIRLEGRGTNVQKFTIDGIACDEAKIPSDLTGNHHICIILAE